MKKIISFLIITSICYSGYSKKLEIYGNNNISYSKIDFAKNSDSKKEISGGKCRLMEEQENGVTEIFYKYDSLDRLIEKKFVKFDYSETYQYDENGYLTEISNNSPNPCIISYQYQNGLLISKTQKYRRLSSPKTTTYEYNSAKELIRMSEEYLSNVTETEFKKGIAVKISNPYIQYDLNTRGLVIKSMSVSGPATINTYKYDSNDMLLLNEVYSGPNKKIMYSEYESSNIKKTNLGDEFVDNYKGFPIYKNPYGDKGYYLSRVSNFNTNSKTGLMEKTFENKINVSVDGTGKIMGQTPIKASEPSRIYIYSGCSN